MEIVICMGTLSQPQANDKLNAPSHSQLHRAIAAYSDSPAQSIVVDSSGNVVADKGTLTLQSSLSGVLKASAGLVSGGATTDDLTEGSNLYFTPARAIAAIASGQVTNGVFFYDGANVTTNANLTWDGSTFGVGITGSQGIVSIKGATSQPGFILTGFSSSIASITTSSGANRTLKIGNSTNSAVNFKTIFGLLGASVTDLVGIASDPTHSLTLGSTTTGIALYNTSDQTTNYERWQVRTNTNVFEIGSFAGGSGTVRSIRIGLEATAGSGSLGRFLTIGGSSISGRFAFSDSTSATGLSIVGIGGTLSASSLLQQGLYIGPNINQSGTAGYIMLFINPTEQATGSGTRNLIDAQVGSTARFSVSVTGLLSLSSGLGGQSLQPDVNVNGNLRTLQFGNGTSATSEGFRFWNSNTSTSLLMIQQSGLIGFGTNAPTHTITIPSVGTGIALYNTSDQTTNYERGFLGWVSNALILRTDNGGSGSARGMHLGTSTTSRLIIAQTAPYVSWDRNSSNSTADAFIKWGPQNNTAASGVQTFFSIVPSYTQTSTGGYTVLLINPTESSVGSGAKRLISMQVGGVDRVYVTNDGVFFPVRAATVSAPTYVLGGVYYDTTLNKLRIGGAAGWETVTSA